MNDDRFFEIKDSLKALEKYQLREIRDTINLMLRNYNVESTILTEEERILFEAIYFGS